MTGSSCSTLGLLWTRVELRISSGPAGVRRSSAGAFGPAVWQRFLDTRRSIFGIFSPEQHVLRQLTQPTSRLTDLSTQRGKPVLKVEPPPPPPPPLHTHHNPHSCKGNQANLFSPINLDKTLGLLPSDNPASAHLTSFTASMRRVRILTSSRTRMEPVISTVSLSI